MVGEVLCARGLHFFLRRGLGKMDRLGIGLTRSIFPGGNIASLLEVVPCGSEHTTSSPKVSMSGIMVTGTVVFIISASNLLRGVQDFSFCLDSSHISDDLCRINSTFSVECTTSSPMVLVGGLEFVMMVACFKISLILLVFRMRRNDFRFVLAIIERGGNEGLQIQFRGESKDRVWGRAIENMSKKEKRQILESGL